MLTFTQVLVMTIGTKLGGTIDLWREAVRYSGIPKISIAATVVSCHQQVMRDSGWYRCNSLLSEVM